MRLLKIHILPICFCSLLQLVVAAPSNNNNKINSDSGDKFKESYIDSHAWPFLKHHDIWSETATMEKDADDEVVGTNTNNDFIYDSTFGTDSYEYIRNTNERQSKVIHLFPVPVDGECLSDDGRRTGTCYNAYECRQKGGIAKGECAMGFGVCCIFIANCNETISNNITYLVSPSFPSFMPNNFSSCNLKVNIMNDEISQLRFDFYHFSMGQPNRRTGVCDGDIFNVTGGPSGTFSLCGQNSGQHIYYDVGGRAAPRQTLYGNLRPLTYAELYPNATGNNASANAEQTIEIDMNFAQRFLPIRLWEIRIAQIPFSQRAPAGCLQFFTGNSGQGILQTFNFAENGRHLANQQYRICMRQETDRCSIVYQPCDEQSFRIGPSMPFSMNMFQQIPTAANVAADAGAVGSMESAGAATVAMSQTQSGMMQTITADALSTMQMSPMMSSTTLRSITNATATLATTPPSTMATNATTLMMSSTAANTTSASSAETSSAASSAAAMETSTTMSTVMTSSSETSPLSDDVEGSGDDSVTPASTITGASRRPRPVSGGFDLFGLLRSAFDLNFRRRRRNLQLKSRQGRQFFSNCNDRITMPCIIEDFIGTGLGPLPNCEPVHCGMQFCSSGMWPCRIESTVTPFYIGVHFGGGTGKGSAEDNIGMCLRYTQMQCL